MGDVNGFEPLRHLIGYFDERFSASVRFCVCRDSWVDVSEDVVHYTYLRARAAIGSFEVPRTSMHGPGIAGTFASPTSRPRALFDHSVARTLGNAATPYIGLKIDRLLPARDRTLVLHTAMASRSTRLPAMLGLTAPTQYHPLQCTSSRPTASRAER